MKPLGFSPNGTVDFDRLQIELDILRAQQLVPPSTTASDVVDNHFAEAAVAKLGRYQ